MATREMPGGLDADVIAEELNDVPGAAAGERHAVVRPLPDRKRLAELYRDEGVMASLPVVLS
jgi:hypothetical protein